MQVMLKNDKMIFQKLNKSDMNEDFKRNIFEIRVYFERIDVKNVSHPHSIDVYYSLNKIYVKRILDETLFYPIMNTEVMKINKYVIYYLFIYEYYGKQKYYDGTSTYSIMQ